MPADDWPADPDLVERVPLRSCHRRGAAIDLVLDRGRENRSQLVFTSARGRDVVFWQSPRTRKQARPNVRTPERPRRRDRRTGDRRRLPRAIPLPIRQPAGSDREAGSALRDYGTTLDGRLVAAVERKSLADLATSLTTGKLRYALGELAALPRAAVVIEDRYSAIFKLTHTRPATVADELAETPGALAERADRVRRGPRPSRRKDLSLSRRRPPVGTNRTRRHRTPRPARHTSATLPTHPTPPPPKSAPGPAPQACPSPTADGCAPKSGTPGEPPTNR